MDLEERPWEEAAAEVLSHLLRSQVCLSQAQIRDWSGWTARQVDRLLQGLESAGQARRCEVKGLGEGWTMAEDEGLKPRPPSPAVFMLHRADPLVKSHRRQLKQQFAGEVLQYLLIDGEFRGAVCGHWRIGPHDVEDIALHLPSRELAARRGEVLAAVAAQYHPPHHQIRRYAGRVLKG